MALFYDPFAPLLELSRDRRLGADATASFVPAADVVMSDEDVTLVTDVPGVNADDLTIELREDVLTVRGERSFPDQAEEAGDGRAWRRLERGFGSFERVLRLPVGLDADAIAASLRDGVLTVRVPKPEARKPRRIEITSGRESGTIEGTVTDQRQLAGPAA
jgi:HSP20 family protein